MLLSIMLLSNYIGTSTALKAEQKEMEKDDCGTGDEMEHEAEEKRVTSLRYYRASVAT